MSKRKKKDEQIVKLAFITVAMELIKALTELLIKLIEIVGGD